MWKAARDVRTGALAIALGLAPAHAAAVPSTPEVAAWLAANTDIAPAQVVIAGPGHVYSLEPLGPPTAAGEVVVLVRAERIARETGGPSAFPSWDGHLLFDCLGGRLRTIRSAAYPRQNRKGAPRVEAAAEGWERPEGPEPAARLLAAACDPAFAWPLRVAAAPTPASAPRLPDPAPMPSAAPPAPPTYAVQIARGPSEEGARRALKAARKTLGPLGAELTDTTEVTRLGAAHRYTVRLAGFRDEAAARDACRTLTRAGHDCFPWQAGADASPSPEPAAPPAAPTVAVAGHAVQVARGPSEEGAQRALKAARKTLGPAADGLTATTELTHVGSRRRYTALLTGFPTAADAARACETLTKAGQACFPTRQGGAD